ncbi:MFS transporter [Oculatella sp. LEGE 06141]|uniref:MFS transporter n=1 Tax=Oculatella sp. LEGE 06141 TaxID=1828648 RepID=UPI0018830435|nr:MFS transporter [Oculatella sp. LEGE 06141]MBE9178543.1 MFS transporter [Oculatella sp. LEGE 06141]
MKTFILIWLGQMVSTIGSAMTVFAFILWVWERTESATTLSLFGFFSELPLIGVMLVAGVLVDQANRKRLMILGDAGALFSTIGVTVLYAAHLLEVWHLYIIVALQTCFSHVQNLAYSASISTMLPKEHYARAGAMRTIVSYSATILAPGLAGFLYPMIGLRGILGVDIGTALVAIATLCIVQIPQPVTSHSKDEPCSDTPTSLWHKLTFGLRYIWQSPNLLALTIAFSCFWFFHQLGEYVFKPMILARTDGSAIILGSVSMATGAGGLIGGGVMSIWKGFHPRIHGMLLGFMGAGIGKLVVGISPIPLVWILGRVYTFIHFPVLLSSSNAIWYAKVAPGLQGRVFAADQLIGIIVGAFTALLAGPLADGIFEPAMQPNGILVPFLGFIFGTGDGAGMSLLYVIVGFATLLVGCWGYRIQRLREVEIRLPDHDEI